MVRKGASETIYQVFPAFRHRNFRLYWCGQCISLIGTWMQNIGQAWLVLELTNSALKLSIVSSIQFLPMMLFSLYFGALIDRFPKRRLLIITQSGLCVLAFILATLTYFQIVQYWHVLLLALFLGILNTLDMPTRQSFFIELVGREDLMNAIGLNSSIVNLARVLGPAAAGILIGWLGIGMCFYLNALSFLAVIAGLLMINIPRQSKTKGDVSLGETLSDIRMGLRYINERKIIKQPLLLMAVISTFVMNYNVVIPVFAQQNLGQNATGYGFLMTSMGTGSLLAALTVVAMSKSGPRLKYLLGGALGMSFFWILSGWGKNYLAACVTLFVVGFCSVTFTALVNSTIQLNSADAMRGRVMSVFTFVFGGVVPIGSLVAGNLTEYAGAPGCMIVTGIIGMTATFYTIHALRDHRHKEIAHSG